MDTYEPGDNTPVIKALRSDPRLSATDAEMLVEMYRAVIASPSLETNERN